MSDQNREYHCCLKTASHLYWIPESVLSHSKNWKLLSVQPRAFLCSPDVFLLLLFPFVLMNRCAVFPHGFMFSVTPAGFVGLVDKNGCWLGIKPWDGNDTTAAALVQAWILLVWWDFSRSVGIRFTPLCLSSSNNDLRFNTNLVFNNCEIKNIYSFQHKVIY